MSSRLALALPLAAVLSACVFHVPGGHGCAVRVDGVELREQHQETLDVAAWDAAGLVIEVALADLSIEATDGPSRIVATLHEVELGDARLAYEGGVLTTRSASGEPTALGNTTVYVHGELSALRASIGMGDLFVQGLEVAGELRLSTGHGDVELRDTRAGGAVVLSSGMGDLDLQGIEAAAVQAESGMGDVTLREVRGTEASLSSGMGDVTLHGCAFERLDAGTGMGDVTCRDTTYARGNLDSGFGSVHR